MVGTSNPSVPEMSSVQNPFLIPLYWLVFIKIPLLDYSNSGYIIIKQQGLRSQMAIDSTSPSRAARCIQTHGASLPPPPRRSPRLPWLPSAPPGRVPTCEGAPRGTGDPGENAQKLGPSSPQKWQIRRFHSQRIGRNRGLELGKAGLDMI